MAILAMPIHYEKQKALSAFINGAFVHILVGFPGIVRCEALLGFAVIFSDNAIRCVRLRYNLISNFEFRVLKPFDQCVVGYNRQSFSCLGPGTCRMIVHTYVSMILFCWRREQTNSHQLTETPQTKNVMARTTSLIISYDNMIMLSQCVPAGGGFVWAVDKAAILSGK